MRHTRWMLIAGLLLAGAQTAGAQEGSAGVGGSTGEFNIAVGLKWSPLRYTKPITGVSALQSGKAVEGLAGCGNGASVGDSNCMSGWQTTSLDSYIAFFFHPQIGFQIGLDIGYSGSSYEFQAANTPTQTGSVSFFQFGFSLGGKFYLTRPTAQRVSPYLYVDFFKYFASVSPSDSIVGTGPLGSINAAHNFTSYVGGLQSPLGGSIAFGAEYFLTRSFSLGAEVFGFRIAYAQGELDSAGGVLFTKQTYFSMYTAITLNYRFLASASVRLEAEVEAGDGDKPKTRRPKRRPVEEPTDQPPPPSPESVD